MNTKKIQEKIKFHPHPKQQEILKCDDREIVIAAGTRGGKSALCGYIATLELMKPNTKTWIIAPTYELTNKVFDYVVQYYLTLFPSQKTGISYRPFPRIKTPIGSVLEGKSAETPQNILGDEIDLAIMDECSRISPKIWENYAFRS